MTSPQSPDAQAFARILSHDLAPLIRSSKQLAAYVREDILREDADGAMHALGMMEVRIAGIDRFVNELVRYFRAGTRAQKPEQFSLTETIQSIFAKQIRVSGPQLHLTCSRDIIIADLTQVKFVVAELLRNAYVHHDDAESLMLNITISHASDDSTTIAVNDNGPGVPDSFLSRVLDPFVKIGGKSGAAGLGLAICREELHSIGGSIQVAANQPRGLSVTVTFPSAEVMQRATDRPTIRPLDGGSKPSLKVV
ncbi:MAG: HAMP domain-containing sensor histidine kinase [Pseudomonadota bacterium]